MEIRSWGGRQGLGKWYQVWNRVGGVGWSQYLVGDFCGVGGFYVSFYVINWILSVFFKICCVIFRVYFLFLGESFLVM